jgi:hypothetical protein
VTGGERLRPVALVWLLLTGLSAGLALRASAAAPPGTVFVGTFYYSDDFYNYLSYVQQAEDGALIFRNKLASPSLPPALVNLEWLSVGWLSRLLGREPIMAYRLFGLFALLAFVALSNRWLRRAGAAPSRNLPALLLVFTGGGLGGLLFALGLLPGERAYDLRAGLFPFVEVLANPHFVAGTVLLLLALGAFAEARPRRGILYGTLLGLVRPYDAALLAGIEVAAALLREPFREWPRKLLPVVGLAPVLTYNAWLFLASPGFRIFSSPGYAADAPGSLDLALALGPAAALALSALRVRDGDEAAGRHRLYLALWAGAAVAAGLLRPASFSLQFLAGVGLPLLALAAIGLSHARRGLLEAAVPLLAATAVVATWLLLAPSPSWHVPAVRWRVAAAMRPVCRAGDLALAPADVGLYVGGLTACWPFVSHAAAPEHSAREAAVRLFYSTASPGWRARFLDERCVTHVVLPASTPVNWLGTAIYRPRTGTPSGPLTVFTRDPGAPCPPPAP